MKEDIPKLQKYLRKTFRCESLRVVMHPKKKDMAEVSVGDEFIATLYREEDDGEVSYALQMAILDVDLADA
ncbi:MAG: DUF3126 family protein [Hyphomicrobiaceae bacterium]